MREAVLTFLFFDEKHQNYHIKPFVPQIIIQQEGCSLPLALNCRIMLLTKHDF